VDLAFVSEASPQASAAPAADRPEAAPPTPGAQGAAAEREARLLRRIIAHDVPAFEELYRLYHPRLLRFLGRMLRSGPVVDEVLDDTMMVVWDRAEAFTGTSKASTWIFGIAYRKALKALRRRRDEPVEDFDAEFRPSLEDGPEDELGRRQARKALVAAMASLSPDQRAVVELCYFQEMGYREIAEIMACPVDTVKTRMFHARRRLKDKLASSLADWL